jgi:hypothetical protein
VTLSGTYVFTGGVVINAATVTGSSALIYLSGSATQLSMVGGTLSITAPTSGTYAGIAIFQDRSDATAMLLGSVASGGGALLNVSGAIYAAGAAVTYIGGATTSGTSAAYTLLVASSASFQGNITFNNNFSTLGANPLGHISIAE